MKTNDAIKKQKVIRLVNEMKRFGITVDDVLAFQGQVADTWSAEDLDKMMRDSEIVANPALTQDEKLLVIKTALKNRDVNDGMTWKHMEWHLRNMFGDRIISD